ncbi:MAG: hypothetical protein PHN98_06190 [Smithellaceae bacterium]|jgi:hypothetical protein|nr:hypothetical protein [Smithellaceae bacterium]
MKTEHDAKLIRCPKLGDEMTFAYCLHEAGSLPCSRIIQCWFKFFDVAAVLEKHMAPDDWKRFTSDRPVDKMSSLIEIIEKAKKQI